MFYVRLIALQQWTSEDFKASTIRTKCTEKLIYQVKDSKLNKQIARYKILHKRIISVSTMDFLPRNKQINWSKLKN